MTDRPSSGALRRCALAVSVLTDLDLTPTDDGVLLAGTPEVHVGWPECVRALAGADADSAGGRDRLHRWLLGRRRVADCGLEELAERARPLGMPVDHALHPGLDWVQARVFGGALDLGIGFAGLDPSHPDDVVAVRDSVLCCYDVDASRWWPNAVAYLEEMGAMAVGRWRRDPRPPLRPMGDCDVVTLLGSAVLRGALAGAAGGMRAVAVPMRSRGWLDLRGIDPAFALTAASLTDHEHRGFRRPLLVTAEEVVMVAAGGRPEQIVLRDKAPAQEWSRDVLLP